MYLKAILWLLSWPVFIFITYRIILYALKRFEKINNAQL
jgi:hypothetical protein